MLSITVVASIGDNDVIDKLEVDHHTRIAQALGELVVLTAGTCGA